MYAGRSAPPLQGPLDPVTDELILAAAAEATQQLSWVQEDFEFIRNLQRAERNHGSVELMMSMKRGGNFAVKQMPTRWVTTGPEAFKARHPHSSEQPWYDIGLVRHLNNIEYPHAATLLGVFHGGDSTYVVSEFLKGGDLFSWCDTGPPPGKAREALIGPILLQILTALRWLHEIGIAHRDISLENVMLTDGPTGKDQVVKIIDFGMSSLSRMCPGKEVRGKQSYQAPEMHEDSAYDAFLVDVFAIGVVSFPLAAQDYPWYSTTRGSCKLFDFVRKHGLIVFLEKRQVRRGSSGRLIEAMSPAFVEFLLAMTSFSPQKRCSLGEGCYAASEEDAVSHQSCWDLAWVRAHMAQPGA